MKRNFVLFLIFTMGLLAFDSGPCLAKKGLAMVKAGVVDVEGKPVKGAYIFFYDSADTRRAVDLVSPVTDKNGYCQKEVPPGRYWVLARLKSNASFDMGPLMIEDKFSGDPLQVEVVPDQELRLDFIVMDLLDTIRTKSKIREDLNKVTGRVVNEKGEPIADVFAYANRHQSPLSVPDYFSAWTKLDGSFTIYLPKGKYNLGAAAVLSPGQRYKAVNEIVVDANLSSLELVIDKPPEKKVESEAGSD